MPKSFMLTVKPGGSTRSLRAKEPSKLPVDPQVKAKKRPMTSAERKRLQRQRDRFAMSPAEREEHLKKERMRVHEIRNKKRKSAEGRNELSEQYKNWHDKSRKNISRQKKQALLAKDRERKSKTVSKPDASTLDEIENHETFDELVTSTPVENVGDPDVSLTEPQPSSTMSLAVPQPSVIPVAEFELPTMSPPTMSPPTMSTSDVQVHPDSSDAIMSTADETLVSPSASKSTTWRRKTEIKKALISLTPKSKAATLAGVIEECSPTTSSHLTDAGVTKPQNAQVVQNLQYAFETLDKHDNTSNLVRSTLLKGVAGPGISGRGLSRLFGVGRPQANAAMKARNAVTIQWQMSLRQAPRSSRLSDEIRDSVLRFYYKPEISRELPCKRDQLNIKNSLDGSIERIPKRILEVTLTEAYREYKKLFPENTIGQRSFEMLRPKEVGFAKARHREVCCCLYHTNLEMMLKTLNQLAINGGAPNKLFDSVHSLVDATQCDKLISCILRECDNCGVRRVDDILPPLKCRRECPCADCMSECSTTWQSYERVARSDTDTQKRLSLVTKKGTLSAFIETLKKLLEPFSLHRFMAGHQSEQYRLAAQNLGVDEVLSIMDFSENYSVIVPKEVQSLHWVNVQATLYVVVLTRHAREDVDGFGSTVDDPHLVDEHHIFVSDDKVHDSHMVEHCKKLLLDQLPFKPTRTIEFCDGASSQFKSIRSLAYIARSEERYGIPTIRYWWETSHGKNKADGAGGVVKQSASMAVVRREEVIRDVNEFYNFCVKNLDKVGQYATYASTSTKTVKRKFYHVKSEDVNRNQDIADFKTLKGTRSLHEARSVNNSGMISVRKRGCACTFCLTATDLEQSVVHDMCINNHFVDELVLASLKTRAAGVAETWIDEPPGVDEEPEVFVPVPLDLTGIFELNSIAVIRCQEELTPYYLIRVTQPPHTLESEVKDSYGNTFGIGLTVIKGHYFELIPRHDNVYYVDTKREAYVNIKCLIPTVCPPLEISEKLVRGKMCETFKVSLTIHEELLSFLV